MDLRSYTKQELALLYFPDATPAVASAHLMRWIQRIPDLLQKLAATGYGKNCKEFTPMQGKDNTSELWKKGRFADRNISCIMCC